MKLRLIISEKRVKKNSGLFRSIINRRIRESMEMNTKFVNANVRKISVFKTFNLFLSREL